MISFTDEVPFQFFESSEERRQVERYDEACAVPTIEHPEAIHI